jgi:transcriptional regulator
MASDKSDLLQGTLDMLVLKIVALEPVHGYGIAQRIQQGSLYPALHRLEKRGWLKADWRESETGREAKFYSLTRLGRKQLDAETANWDRLAGAVELILKTAE